jgi:hypothetical protein
VSSLLKCGTTLTEVALAIREFFLVGKRVEGTEIFPSKEDMFIDIL